MKNYRSIKHLRYAAWAVMAASVLASAPASVRAQEEDEKSIWNLDQRIYRGVLDSLGVRTNKDDIDYRERSPLVLPPGRELPAPQAAAPPPKAWPVDPDVKRRREAAKKKYDARFSREEHRGEILAPSELGDRPGGAAPGAGPGGPSAADARESGNSVLPSSLGYVGGLFSWSGFGFGTKKEESVTFTKEPERSTLIEPPPGYQTPSAAQPYGLLRRDVDTKPAKRPEDRVVD
jgi:hypothetical protein